MAETMGEHLDGLSQAADGRSAQKAIDERRRASFVPVNDQGKVIGECHPNSRFTDREVEIMRTMHEQGCGLTELAMAFETDKKSVWRIVTYRARAQTVAGHRRREVAKS